MKCIEGAVRSPDSHTHLAQPGDYLPQQPQEREVYSLEKQNRANRLRAGRHRKGKGMKGRNENNVGA